MAPKVLTGLVFAKKIGKQLGVDLETAVSLGLIEGAGFFRKEVYAGEVHISNLTDIWDNYNNQGVPVNKVWFTTATALFASSSAAGDTTQLFQIVGIGPDNVLQRANVTLTGRDQVAIPGTWLACNCIMNITAAGTLTTGDVYIAEDVESDITNGVPDDLTKIQCIARAEHQRCTQSHFMVPAGYRAYMKNFLVGAGSHNYNVVGKLQEPSLPWRTFYNEKAVASHVKEFDGWLSFEAGTRLMFQATGTQPNNPISLFFSMMLLPITMCQGNQIVMTTVTELPEA